MGGGKEEQGTNGFLHPIPSSFILAMYMYYFNLEKLILI